MIEPIICKGCEQSLSSDCFYTDKTKPSGLRSKCKACMRKDELDRKAKNPEQFRQQKAAHTLAHYYRNHEASKQKNKEKERKRRQSNPEHIRALEALGRERNRARIRSRQRQDRLNNPIKYKAIDAKRYEALERKVFLLNRSMIRRAKKYGCQVFTVSIQELIDLYSQACIDCNTTGFTHIDHIVPLVRKGCHGIGNLQPLCAACNLSKGSKTMTEWKKAQRQDAILANPMP